MVNPLTFGDIASVAVEALIGKLGTIFRHPVEEVERGFQEIVRRVESLFELARGIERCLESSSAGAGALVQSILRSPFSGELVPTEAELARREGRPYEPASELLTRIRAKREVSQSKAKGRNNVQRTRRKRIK